MRYFPLVGVLIGGLNLIVWWLASRRLPSGVSIGLMMAASLLLTGALHEDGLADTCDGLGGGASREQALAIMKDSRIGAYGALGLFFTLGLKWTTLAALPAALFAPSVIASHMLSRFGAIGLIAFLPYARAEAETGAKARLFADHLGAVEWIWSGLIGLAALAPLAWLCARSAIPIDWSALLAGAPPPRRLRSVQARIFDTASAATPGMGSAPLSRSQSLRSCSGGSPRSARCGGSLNASQVHAAVSGPPSRALRIRGHLLRPQRSPGQARDRRSRCRVGSLASHRRDDAAAAVIYTSPASRCLSLARALAAPRAPRIAEELLEMHFGAWEGIGVGQRAARGARCVGLAKCGRIAPAAASRLP